MATNGRSPGPDHVESPTATPGGLWLLADSRLPTGGHAHSGGVEAAAARGEVRSPADLAQFLAARVPTAGLVAAAFAAGACARGPAATGWALWEAAVSARLPAAGLREASRAQGRALARTGAVAWPCPALDALGRRPHQTLVLGALAAAAGGSTTDAAGLALHHLVGQASAAAVRLLGLDPLAAAAVSARALHDADTVVTEAAMLGAAAAADDAPDALPDAATPRPEVLAVLHTHAEGALFAS